jgi:hypothetical protein
MYPNKNTNEIGLKTLAKVQVLSVFYRLPTEGYIQGGKFR